MELLGGEDPCKPITCEDKEVSNTTLGTITLQGNYASDSVNVTCLPGFTGGGEFICDKDDGKWKGETCQEYTCTLK